MFGTQSLGLKVLFRQNGAAACRPACHRFIYPPLLPCSFPFSRSRDSESGSEGADQLFRRRDDANISTVRTRNSAPSDGSCPLHHPTQRNPRGRSTDERQQPAGSDRRTDRDGPDQTKIFARKKKKEIYASVRQRSLKN